jgi:uncharacterized protein with GYD domain
MTGQGSLRTDGFRLGFRPASWAERAPQRHSSGRKSSRLATSACTQEQKERAVTTYVVLFNWTEQGIRNYKDSPSRAEAAKKQWGEAGIQIKDLYWTVGPFDLVAVVEAPDDESLTSGLLALGAQGNLRSTTMRAFGAEEFAQLI